MCDSMMGPVWEFVQRLVCALFVSSLAFLAFATGLYLLLEALTRFSR